MHQSDLHANNGSLSSVEPRSQRVRSSRVVARENSGCGDEMSWGKEMSWGRDDMSRDREEMIQSARRCRCNVIRAFKFQRESRRR